MANRHEGLDLPTTMRARMPDGRCIGADNSVWLYRKVPLGPVDDAVDTDTALAVGAPLMDAFDELENMARVRVNRRRMASGAYRHIHLQLVNIPRRFEPDKKQPLREWLTAQFPKSPVDRRVLLLGVRLRDEIGGGAGFAAMADSVIQTLVSSEVPLSDFDRDFQMVDAALSRAGLTTPSAEDFRLANAWWNTGKYPDTPTLVHSDHLHVFTSPESLTEAAALEEDKVPCRNWPKLPRHGTVSMVAVQDLNFRPTKAGDPGINWFSELMSLNAIAVSVRASIEPQKVTRAELRANRKGYIDDINEASREGKMQRSEQDETLAFLSEMEGIYAREGAATPTLVDASCVAALNGVDVNGRHDATGIGRAITLSNLVERQSKAMTETMLCSNVRANPHLHDWPAQTVAMTGAPSLSVVGDTSGALLGFTERDRQPAYISPTAASTADGLPLMLVAGATGSGKDFQLSTKLATPLTSENATGWTTVGEVKVGDTVFGRDGKTCKVTYLSPIKPMPPMYELSFSDGQKLIADADHQWVVSSFKDRNDRHRPKRVAAIENRNRMLEVAGVLDDRAVQFGPDHTSTLAELFDLVREVEDVQWETQLGLYGALHFMEVPSHIQTRTREVPYTAKETRKTDPAKLFDVHALLRANLQVWEGASGTNAVRWRKQLDGRIAAAKHLLATVPTGTMDTAPSVARLMATAGAVQPKPGHLREVAYKAGVQAVDGFTEVVVPLPESTTATWDATVYPTAIAFKALAERVRQQHHDAPVGHVTEQRMTTAEMLGAGLKASANQSNFAIRLAGALDLPEVELPVTPYVMGAWLGDGSSNCGQIASSTADSCSHGGVSDQEHMVRQLQASGYSPYPLPSSADVVLSVPELSGHLRAAGVLNNKHIPMTYQRASIDQRLALLQGLMDTDGTISETGRCELTLCNERLATDALQLIRSLGIKATMKEGVAAYTLTDPETGEKTRTVTGTRYRIQFTASKPVFRLPRKAERVLPEGSLRDTQQWLYVTDIRPVESRPGRCIQVDSPDHTYLAGEGFVPSSNTQALLWMAYQFAQPCENPDLENSWAGSQIILDPKQKSDHSDVVKAAGGQVVSLDDLMTADGVFDPLRFAGNAEAGIEAASSVLLQVNPWGGRKADFETDLTVALTYGVAEGATCVGQALKIALEAGRAKPEMVQPVLDLAVASPMFSACVGMDPKTEGLRVSEGITLIKVGDTHLDLPQPGKHPDSMGQRIAVALVRMMVYGSAMALTGRRGVLHMDEAWIFLLGGASEVERLGRLARSQEVFPIMYTQRVSDAVNAGLTGYISRGLILAIKDKDEARAACELFELEPTPYRMGRITAQATKSGTDSSLTGAPNWNSLRALKDPETRKVLRGSVGIYVDLDGRAVPTVITLPPEFLKMSSTNTADLREKLEEKKRRAAQGLAEVMPLRGVEDAHAEVAERAAEQMARHTEAMASSLDDTGDPDTEIPEDGAETPTGQTVDITPPGQDDDWEDLRNLG